MNEGEMFELRRGIGRWRTSVSSLRPDGALAALRQACEKHRRDPSRRCSGLWLLRFGLGRWRRADCRFVDRWGGGTGHRLGGVAGNADPGSRGNWPISLEETVT